MKKLINSVDTMLAESLDGFAPPMPISLLSATSANLCAGARPILTKSL